MRILTTALFSIPLSFLALTEASDAAACGGCIIEQQESTQVTGHKMILSISKTQTTLWDQISYSGNPSSFAWILPIKGTVTIGLSSDALFKTLEERTNVVINSPILQCSPPPFCGGFGTAGATGGSDGAANAPVPVNVLAQEVVGPYETVQLAATDPNALKNWLSSHNYNLPADIAPVVDAYVGEGFNFLALKLVPGQGISAMRPVRVTTPGASLVLPLRMVAAGTGAVTPITLWVLGEGRYETTSLPNFTIDPSQIVWDWDTQSSNYAELQKDAFTKSGGRAWQVETAEPSQFSSLASPLDSLVRYDPKNSGYSDDGDKPLQQVYDEDMDALVGGIHDSSLWVTRLHSELSRAALASDLTLGATDSQDPVQRFLMATQTKGTAPLCPVFPPCDNDSWGFWGVDDNGAGGASSGGTVIQSSCAMTDHGDSSALVSGALLGAAFTVSRLRRRRRR